jgi:hypothetical protein
MAKWKKISFTILFLGMTYFIISYHSEKKKYEIISEIFNDIDFKPEKICLSEIVLEFKKDIFEEFSLFDKISVYSQVAIQNLKRTTNCATEIKANQIKYNDDLNKPIFPEILLDCSTAPKKTKENDRVFWELKSLNAISLPILSSDNKTAVMQIETHCGGLCGDGCLYVFKKINGKWTVAKKILRWIS